MPQVACRRRFRDSIAVALLLLGTFAFTLNALGEPVGDFTATQDVGTVLHSGSAAFDPVAKAYTLAGSGENMWAAKDAFRFLFRPMTGDVEIGADVTFLGAGTDPHRKAVLMIRQSLDEDASYVDVALHGDGLTSLQFRAVKGGRTQEVQANVKGPVRLKLEKRGKCARMHLADAAGKPFAFSGAAVPIEFAEPFYVGLGVCSHDKDVVERAVFNNVSLGEPPPEKTNRVHATLETLTLSSTDRRVVLTTDKWTGGAAWTPDGTALLHADRKQLLRVPLAGGHAEPINTGDLDACGFRFGFSPDGATLAFTDKSYLNGRGRSSFVYTMPAAGVGGGGKPKQVTPHAGARFGGWSPDGKSIVYCREGDGESHVFTILSSGGDEERQLTSGKPWDDHPTFSPDGRLIYFNRATHVGADAAMRVWRMNAADGSNPERITDDALDPNADHTCPRISPDGKAMVFLAYPGPVLGNSSPKDAELRLMNLETKKVDVLARVVAGPGTLDGPCWSPDGKRLAFVTYQWVP